MESKKNINIADFYIIIRSADERSLPLCQQAVEKTGVGYEVIKVHPFWKAVLETFKIGIKKGRKFTVGLDADVVLYKNAVDIFSKFIGKNPGYWRYDFALKDRFYSQSIWGVHIYKTKILSMALANCPKNIQKIPKPERQFCYQLKKKGYKDINSDIVVGRHGYNQYYQDIFNRFLHRAVRNPEYKDILFNSKRVDDFKNGPEFLMAYLGWQEGEAFLQGYKKKMRLKKMLFGKIPVLNKKLSEKIFFPLDSKKKKDIRKYLKKYQVKELETLNLK